MKTAKFAAALLLGASLVMGSALAQDRPIVGLITKTETNPFFVKMREGAQAKADELGLELLTAAGSFDGDNEAQVTAIENMVNAGAAGICSFQATRAPLSHRLSVPVSRA